MRFTRQGRSELRRAWWWSALNGLGWSALYVREAALRREGPRPSEQPAARAAAGCRAAVAPPRGRLIICRGGALSRRHPTLPEVSPEVSQRYPGGIPEAGRGMPLK